MPRRVTLTDRQKDALLRLPTSQTDLLKHYTLSDEDLGHIRLRRRAHNRFGFALQLCVLRYPGRVLAPGELIPAEVIEFIGAQLGLGADDLVDYAAREETRHEHLAELRGLYGFRTFSGRGASELKEWLFREAEMAVSNEDIARRFVAECRRTRTVLPATSTIERLCAAALVDAERRIETRIASRLPMSIREQLLALLEETADDRVTRFVWLRQFEPGSNSSSANRLLDRLEYLQRIDLPEDLLAGVPAHRVTRLRRQGERYYADGMRDLPEDRRLAILAVCVSEWQAMLADAVVETHDRIVGRLYRASERICHAKVADEAGVVRDTLKSFAEIGGALVDAQDDGQPLGDVIASGSGWDGLKAHYPEIKSSNPSVRAFNERAAINAPIQGSAADIIRRAMVKMEPALSAAGLSARMLLQVHDELIFEVEDGEVDSTIPVIVDTMENASMPALSMKVPLKVDARAAVNWDEAH